MSSPLCACGAAARVCMEPGGSRVRCTLSGCWSGPLRPTEIEAVEAWLHCVRPSGRRQTLTSRQEEILAFVEERTHGARSGLLLRDLADHFGLSIATVSEHVQRLRDAGALVSHQAGQHAGIYPDRRFR